MWNPATGNCYFFEPYGYVDYSDALYECRVLGADLVSIHSPAENDYLNRKYINNLLPAICESQGSGQNA